MARDLELNVKGNSRDAAAALELAAREMDKAARQADKLGRAFDDAKHDAEQFDRELAKNALAVKALAHEYQAADVEARKDIKKRIDAERSAGNELRKIRSELIGDTERDSRAATAALAVATKEWNRLAGQAEREAGLAFSKAGKHTGDSFSTGFSGVVERGVAGGAVDSANTFASAFQGSLLKNPVIIGIGASLAALLTIPIGAAIGGLTLAGAAIGGAAAAGLAGSKADHSGQVAAGGKDLVASINAQFLKGGESAVEPLLKGIGELKKAVDNLHLDAIIRDAAKFIQPLAAGAGKFADYLSEGADILVRNAGPVVDAVADELPTIGKAFKEFASDIAGGSEGGAQALRDFIEAVANIIIGIGKFIGFAENAYGAIKKFGDGFTDFVDKFAAFSPALGSAALLLGVFGQNAEKTDAVAVRLGDSNEDLASSFDDLHTQMSKVTLDFQNLVTKQIDAREAAIAYEQGIDDLKSAMDAHSHSVDINTEAGRKNVSAADDMIKKAQEHRQALLDEGKSLAEADAAYDSDIARLKAMLKVLGFNNAEIDTMIGLAGKIPRNIKINVSAPGLSSTLGMFGQLANLQSQIGSVVAAAGKAKHRAGGGPVMKGQPYIVGEERPEVFVPGENGTIIPRVPTAQRSVASMWNGGGGTQTVRVELVSTAAAGSAGAGLAAIVHAAVSTGQIQLRAVSGNDSLPVKVA